MIAEWFGQLTYIIGESLNKALGIRDCDPLTSGIMSLWEIIGALVILVICLSISCAIAEKKNKKGDRK